jgi:hypothetical protein
MAGSALVRYAPNAMSVAHGTVFLKFYDQFPQHWIRLSLFWLLLPFAAIGFGLWFVPEVRQGLRNLAQNRRSLFWALLAFFLFLLTMLPLEGPSPSPYSGDQEMVVYLLFGSLGTFLLLVGLAPWFGALARPLLKCWEIVMRLRPVMLVTGAAVFVFLAANAISYFVFHHVPHIHDTVAQMFQARLFAQGKLYIPSPPLPQFFDVLHIINNGRWYSQYPPGHPLILALGVLISAPWIINPVLGGLTVVVIYFLGKEIYDEATARLATVLAALSPFLVFMSSEFMNHSSALLFAALFLLFFARTSKGTLLGVVSPGTTQGRRTPAAIGYPLLAGLALGMVMMIRPLTALMIALPFALEAAYRFLGDPKRNLIRFGLVFAGGALMVALLFGYNYLTNGNPLLFGYVVKYGRGHEIGFGHSGWGEVHTVAKGIVNTSVDLNALNRFLFEFPIPSLVFMALLFAAGGGRMKDEGGRMVGASSHKWDYLLVGTLIMLVGAYFFYWWHGLLFGPRWEYEAFPALILLSVRGIRALPVFIRNDLRLGVSSERMRGALGTFFLLCFVSMFAIAVPTLIKGYLQGFGVLHTTAETIEDAGVHNAVVFTKKYDETFLENKLNAGEGRVGASSHRAGGELSGDVVYAKDLGVLNPILAARYRGRRFYFAHRDTLRELENMDFERSPVKEGLDSVAQGLFTTDLSQYRTVIWPIKELEYMIQPLETVPGLRVISYRELGQLLVGSVSRFKEFLPALAVWILNDRSESLVIFALMDGQQSFIAGDYEFTHLANSINGRVAIYDVRSVEEP